MSYVIIGNGPAGVQAIEKIRKLDQKSRIILISKENNPPYSRIMTPEYMTGEVTEERMFFKGTDFYEKHNVELLLGYGAERIIPEKNTVLLDNGEEIQYCKLLIASGSRPIVPSWVDLETEGVFVLWDKRHSEVINKYLPQVEQAVIIGGGLVGLHTARALTAKGIAVTIIEKLDRLMPLQLDEMASSMILQEVQKNGIRVMLKTEVAGLQADKGKIKAVSIAEQDIPADMVLVSIGVKSNMEMAEDTMLDRDKGILTNYNMQTSIPNIYAAGDVAQAPSRVTGEQEIKAIWPCAVRQGKVAGANMAGSPEEYEGSVALNSLHLFNLSVLSLGQLETEEGLEEKILYYPDSGAYQKLLIRDGKLAGLIFAGDIQQAGILYHKLGLPLYQGYWDKIPALDVEEIVL